MSQTILKMAVISQDNAILNVTITNDARDTDLKTQKPIWESLSSSGTTFGKNIYIWMNKEKLTRAGLEPATSGLTCRGSTNWVILALHWRSPYFVNIFVRVRGAPVRSHETIYCPFARDHAHVTIQPGKRQYGMHHKGIRIFFCLFPGCIVTWA